MTDPIIAANVALLLSRSEVGQRKYGCTLAGAGLSLRDWLVHAREEALDQANYLTAAIMEIDARDGLGNKG